MGATQTRLALAEVEAGRISAPPTKLPSPEDSIRFRAQLRPTFAHRRTAPVPIRVGFAGAEASVNLSPPRRPCSSEDRLRARAQLRPESGNRRKPDHRNPSFDESPLRRSSRHRRATTESLCKSFLTLSTHFPLQIIPTGVLLSAYNRNLKTL